MGASCSCSKCIGFPQDLDLEKERKIHMDFFLDSEDITQDNKQTKIKNTPSNLTSNNNDLPLYTTKSYSNINNINNSNNNNINIQIFGNESYNKVMNQLIGEDDNNKDKEIFIRENNSKGMFINPENKSKELFINFEDDNKGGFINDENDNNRQVFRNVEDNSREVIINDEDNNKGVFRNVEDNSREVIINDEDNNKEVFRNVEDNSREVIINDEDRSKGINRNSENIQMNISLEAEQNDKENMEENNNKFIRASDNENELIIKDENIDEYNISMGNNEIGSDIEEVKDSKVKIKIKPKKVELSHNINNNINKYSIGSIRSAGSANSNISKKEIIYSVSSEIYGKKKYGNENITEEEYKAQPNDEYSKTIFNYINTLRRNPKYIAKMIDENKKCIIMGDNNKLFFRKNGIKFALNKGLSIFNETIDELNNLEPMNKLILNKNIIVDLPDNEDDINNLDYLKNQIEILQNNGNHISSYWKEKIRDPEIAFLMMVIDDNYIKEGLKRKDLINPEYIYIGISSIEINKKFACYITLSNRK